MNNVIEKSMWKGRFNANNGGVKKNLLTFLTERQLKLFTNIRGTQ